MSQPTATPDSATSDAPLVPTAEQIAEFKTMLSSKYAGLTDRELLEITAWNAERTHMAINQIGKAVKPAMEKLANGGLMSMLMGKGK